MLLFLRKEILACHRRRLDAFILLADKRRRFARAALRAPQGAGITCAKVSFPHGIKRLKHCMMARKGAYEPATDFAENPGSVQGIRKPWCRVGTDTFECNPLPVDAA